MNRAGFIGWLTGLALAASVAAADRLKIVTSIPPVHCFTLNVAGDLAAVECLLPSGGSAHDFQFTSRERRQLESANLVIGVGLGFEAWLAKAFQRSGLKSVVQASAGLQSERIDANPHLWLDPLLAARMVTNILVALQKADPSHAAGYAQNAEAFIERLGSLDAEIRAGLTGLTNRSLVTAHDAFPYFARRYDLRIVGVLEEIPDVDPTVGHLRALRRRIEQQGVQAIFVDKHHSSRRAHQLASDFKVQVGVLDTLEGSPLTLSAYEDGMRANLRALQKTLK